MQIPDNVKTKDSCSVCKLRTHNFFCNLSDSTLQKLETLKMLNAYRKGTTLFFEDQASNGIYMLCAGKVKLSTCSEDGKVIILRVAEAGEVLGLSATVAEANYEATAEVLEPCQVSYIRKGDFLRFLNQNPDAALSVAKQLCLICHEAYDQIRSLGLSNSVADKLAKLFITWCKTTGINGSYRLKMS
jgi:CRP/FNR family transcriptional regulator